MKTLLLFCALLPLLLFSQEDIAALPDDSIQPIVDTLVPKPVKDTLNVTDSTGMKQGHWLFFGQDFPNSGVGDMEVLEEGDYVNNQRSGIWYRYGAGGKIKAVMQYVLDPKTKTGVRSQFYYYTYHTNGSIKRKPVIGKCTTASDFYLYDETGVLIEAEHFDADCATTLKLQRIQKGELDSIEIFKLNNQFTEVADPTASTDTWQQFDQTGEYCVDYNHRVFRIGTFVNGELIEGREFHVDEMMRPQRVRYFAGGKLIKTVAKGPL